MQNNAFQERQLGAKGGLTKSGVPGRAMCHVQPHIAPNFDLLKLVWFRVFWLLTAS